MSTSNPRAGQSPVLVVDLLELEHLAAEHPDKYGTLHAAYGESFSLNKTDIAANPATPVTASRQILNGDVRAICGWALAETTNAAPAAIRLRDGSNVQNEVLVRINLAINESTRDWIGGRGIRVSTGRVFLDWISGSVEGVIFWR